MKALEFWAKKHAKNYPEGRERDVAYTSYIDGFRSAREHAANMIEDFNNPQKFIGIPLLLRVIGQGECDENGKPKET